MKKFDVLGVIGVGAYGIVLKARNKETNKIVAIKKFKESDKESTIRKISTREIKFLKISNHINIVHLIETFRRKEKLHLIFEFAEKTILDLLEKTPKGLRPRKTKHYLFQLLKAVNYLHQKDIIHRDIKPENLLVTKDDVLKICDFGFARKLPKNGGPLTDYVATRWYRSPELLLTDTYGKPSDIWAIGCILGELTDGRPLFPGKDQFDQLYLVTKVLGNLPREIKEMFFVNKEFRGMRLQNIKAPITLKHRYRGRLKGVALDFLQKLLEPNPEKRITAVQALNHPYFEDLVQQEFSALSQTNIPSNKITKLKPQQMQSEKKQFNTKAKQQFLVYDKVKSITTNETSRREEHRINKGKKGIRIKTLDHNPIKKRKTYSQKISKMKNTFGQDDINKRGGNRQKIHRTYYNIYEHNERNTGGVKYSKMWDKENQEKKAYPIYTQLAFHSKNNRHYNNNFEARSIAKARKSQFPKKIKFESNVSDSYRNPSNSVSQFHRKLGFRNGESKHRSHQNKEKKGFNYTGTSYYNSVYGSRMKQLPSISKNTYYTIPHKKFYEIQNKHPQMKFKRGKRFKGVRTMNLNAGNGKFNFSPITTKML